MLPAHGNIISTMVCSGIKATKFYSFLSKELLFFFFLGTLSKELGGASNVGFSG